MKFAAIIIAFLLFISLLSCKDSTKENTELLSPSETRSTMEYNQNQLDTIPSQMTKNEVFKGSGGEPFWSIEINSDSLEFATPDKKISAPIIEPKISVNFTSYDSNFDGGTIRVLLKKENCEDGMSGKNYSHKVEVSIKRNSDKDFDTYTGCGSYNHLE